MRVRLTTTGLVFAVIACGLAINANADTIYMKNGRTIDSSSVRVEGDRVFVRVFQGEVAFPLDKVERIVENNEVERAAGPSAPSVSEPAQLSTPVESSVEDPQAAGSGDPEAAEGGDPPAAEPEEPPAPAPEETREYWQNRIRPLRDQLDGMDAQLRNLRARSGADVQAQISRIETQRSPVQSQLDGIIREARRMNVPAGWLR